MAAVIGLGVFIWALGLWVMLISVAREIAAAKGRDPRNWAWLAFLFGVFAVLCVGLLPAKR